jgi:hypothetical protein
MGADWQLQGDVNMPQKQSSRETKEGFMDNNSFLVDVEMRILATTEDYPELKTTNMTIHTHQYRKLTYKLGEGQQWSDWIDVAVYEQTNVA